MKRKFFNPRLAQLAAIAERNELEMAVPADVQVKNQSLPQGELEALRLQNNNIVATLRLLTAKMDLDAGITDANWNALLTDSAIATAPQKVTTL